MPTGYARASIDDQSLGLQRDAVRRLGHPLRGLVLLGRTPDEAGVGLTGVQEINAGSSGGRPVFHLGT